MAQARYFVVQHGDVWMIKFDDEEFGPYKSKNEAMLFAIDAAQKLGEHGEKADVVLMGENNHVRPEWVYGRDPYPPRLSGVERKVARNEWRVANREHSPPARLLAPSCAWREGRVAKIHLLLPPFAVRYSQFALSCAPIYSTSSFRRTALRSGR